MPSRSFATDPPARGTSLARTRTSGVVTAVRWARMGGWVILGWIAALTVSPSVSIAVDPIAMMPRREDATSMWWAEGFPSHAADLPWLRCIETGHYGFVVDTETMQLPHWGPLSSSTASGGFSSELWNLAPAKLTLRMIVDEKTYTCTAGGKWTRHRGPRLVESGTFFQRADVTDLEFTADDGSRLNVDARFETAAWADRLSLTLAARPGVKALAPSDAGSDERPGNAGQSPNGDVASTTPPSRDRWNTAVMEIQIQSGNVTHEESMVIPPTSLKGARWRQVSLLLDPVNFRRWSLSSAIDITANEMARGTKLPVTPDRSMGGFRIGLDGVIPIVPPVAPGATGDRQNDAMERILFTLTNTSDQEQVARLVFEKTPGGIRQPIGSPLTGISAVIRDADGIPTGIPVQLSKNWHASKRDDTYNRVWFHGISRIRLPPHANVSLELSIVYGHWGGLPAASHAQLCLIGWGSNQLWNQSALGSWGESICYEPDQVQANCTITDVRPLMVASAPNHPRWSWTRNVGGGDVFRMFAPDGKRVAHSAMKSIYHRYGPCLTEVTHRGRLGPHVVHHQTASLSRTDDLVRGTYRLSMKVREATPFSRLVLFQVGADTYNFTHERSFAVGDETGVTRQWQTVRRVDNVPEDPIRCVGRVPWASLHDAIATEHAAPEEARANRGIVIRTWNARLGGKPAQPWMVEHVTTAGRGRSSTLDLVPPPGLNQLEPGDFVDATVEYLVVPQQADQYYGPNQAFREALQQHQNTWRMIHREATQNDRSVTTQVGRLERRYPDVRVRAVKDQAQLTLNGGLGYVPITFTDLSSPRGYELLIDGKPLDQSVHGNDHWQTDFDPVTQRWSRTYNLVASGQEPKQVHLTKQP